MPKKMDANGQEESRDLDSRRWKAQDDNGHLPGSNVSHSNEQDTERLRQQEDDSDLNRLDDRSQVSG